MSVSELMRNPLGPVTQRLALAGTGHVAISIIVASELWFGVQRAGSQRLAKRLAALLERIPVLPLEAPAERHYADIRCTLERAGTPIGPNDLLIAAHARALDLIVVTDNVREFSRVPGLTIENWLDPAYAD